MHPKNAKTLWITSKRLFILDKRKKLNFLIDSGPDISVVPVSSFKGNERENSYVTFASGNRISTYGKQSINVDLGIRMNFPFHFTKAELNKPIKGADFLTEYDIIISKIEE